MAQEKSLDFWNQTTHAKRSRTYVIESPQGTRHYVTPLSNAEKLSPEDLYQIRKQFVSDELTSLDKIDDQYWLPQDTGLQILQNPHKQLLQLLRKAFDDCESTQARNKAEAQLRMEQLEQIIGRINLIRTESPHPNDVTTMNNQKYIVNPEFVQKVKNYSDHFTILHEIANDLTKASGSSYLPYLGYTLMVLGACMCITFILTLSSAPVGSLLTKGLTHAGVSHLSAKSAGVAFSATAAIGVILSLLPILGGIKLTFFQGNQKLETLQTLSLELKQLTQNTAWLSQALKQQALQDELSVILKMVLSPKLLGLYTDTSKDLHTQYLQDLFIKSLGRKLTSTDTEKEDSFISVLINIKQSVQSILQNPELNMENPDELTRKSLEEKFHELSQLCGVPKFAIKPSIHSQTFTNLFTQNWQPPFEFGVRPMNNIPVFHYIRFDKQELCCLDTQNIDPAELKTVLNVSDITAETLAKAYPSIIQEQQELNTRWNALHGNIHDHIDNYLALTYGKDTPAELRQFFSQALYTKIYAEVRLEGASNSLKKIDAMLNQFSKIKGSIQPRKIDNIQYLISTLGIQSFKIGAPSSTYSKDTTALYALPASMEQEYAYEMRASPQDHAPDLIELDVETSSGHERWVLLAKGNNYPAFKDVSQFEKVYRLVKENAQQHTSEMLETRRPLLKR